MGLPQVREYTDHEQMLMTFERTIQMYMYVPMLKPEDSIA